MQSILEKYKTLKKSRRLKFVEENVKRQGYYIKKS
jgi:hypothetical protein